MVNSIDGGIKNLRDFKPSMDKGQDGHDNSFIDGKADGKTPAEKEMNETGQYWTSGSGIKGPLGGEAENE